jgi:hypothetical protein
MNTEEIIQSTEFSDFYKSANNYCSFIENNTNLSTTSFLHALRHKLLNLYQTALMLQWINVRSDVDFDERLDKVEFKKILLSIENRLDGSRYYWHVFDPTNDNDKEPVCGDLADDLGDIYKDLKRSIMIFNLSKKDCKENALWQFKFDFDKHWDDHCINALNAIHYYLENE